MVCYTIVNESSDFMQVRRRYLCDLSQAFDSVPHRLLVNKLRSYQFHPNLLAWLTDNLSIRKQNVIIEGVIPEQVNVSSDLSIGFILGPVVLVI